MYMDRWSQGGIIAFKRTRKAVCNVICKLAKGGWSMVPNYHIPSSAKDVKKKKKKKKKTNKKKQQQPMNWYGWFILFFFHKYLLP